MAFFKVKVGDAVYELDKLTMGDTRVLKHHFGVKDLAEMSSTDPDVIVGLLAIAIRRATGKSLEDATAEADAVDFSDVVMAQDEAEVPEDDAAPLAGVSEATADVTSGSLETIPETSGSPA